MPYGSKLHIPPTNYHLQDPQQEPYKKSLILMKNVSEFSGEPSWEWTISKTIQNRKSKRTSLTRQKNERRDRKAESNDSPEIPNKGEASVIPSLPSGDHQTKSGSKRSYSATPYYSDPEDSDPVSLHNTLDLDRYDHTKFSYKRFSSLEDFHWTFR